MSFSLNQKWSYQFDFLYNIQIIYRRRCKNVDEATICFGDALDSRAVVGPGGERSLLPGHVRSVMVVPVEDPFTCPPGGFRGERITNRSVVYRHVRESGHHRGLREFKVLWRIRLMIRSPLQLPEAPYHFGVPEGLHNDRVCGHWGLLEGVRESKLLLCSCWWSAPLQPPGLYFLKAGPTITILTSWRPPWWPRSRTFPGRRVHSPAPATALESSASPKQIVASLISSSSCIYHFYEIQTEIS